MFKNVTKIIMTLLGISIFIDGIVTEIDGIGRFAMILFGTLFSIIGSFIQFDSKK